jgi:hypothetical protein
LGEDKHVRAVEGHHESWHEPNSRANKNELVVDHVVEDV